MIIQIDNVMLCRGYKNISNILNDEIVNRYETDRLIDLKIGKIVLPKPLLRKNVLSGIKTRKAKCME